MKILNRINMNLLPIKAHYFFWNAGTAPVVPFLSTYARQLGFSSVIVGLIYTILPICGMIAKPCVGLIADRFRCQKLAFLTSQLVTAAAFLAIYYAPSPNVGVGREVQFNCGNSSYFDTSPDSNEVDDCVLSQLRNELGMSKCTMICPMSSEMWQIVDAEWGVNISGFDPNKPFTFIAAVNKSKIIAADGMAVFEVDYITANGIAYQSHCLESAARFSTKCGVDCNDKLNDLIGDTSLSDANTYVIMEFWIFLILMIIGWVGQAVSVSVGDAICFEMLGDKPNRYGYQRMWGALGWGIFAIIAGLMVDSISGESSKKNFQSAFYLAVAFLLVDFLVSSRVNFVQGKLSTNILKGIGRLLANSRIIVFLICCVAVGMCTGLMWNFLFFLIEDLAKAQGCAAENWVKTLEGIVMAVETLAGEMPFFFLSGKILKKIGHVNAMTLVLLVMGIRFILYSVIANPWFFLPFETLNGLTFGLFYACMASYASIVAPDGTEATMQGLVGAVFEGIGVSLGSFTAGLMFDKLGGPMTFRLFGIGSLVMCLLHVGAQFFIK